MIPAEHEFSPLSRPAGLNRHLQSSPVFCSPHPSSIVLARVLESLPVIWGPHRLPVEPASHLPAPRVSIIQLQAKLHHLRDLQFPQVRPGVSSGCTPRYPSVLDPRSATAICPVQTQGLADLTLGNTAGHHSMMLGAVFLSMLSVYL